MNKTKRSPLTSKPLRNPGQSLDEEINKLIDDDAMIYMVMPAICVVITTLEWYRWIKEIPPTPHIWTIVTILVAIYSAYKLHKYRRRIKKLKLGRDGERAVGQYLELLREKGYRIFHDLVGHNFNIDHVIVCEQGVFVIETKTYSKSSKGNSNIIFDGNEITINGCKSKSDIVLQAQAEANWLKEIVKETTGKSFHVKPVIVFPGWYVKSRNNAKQSDVWVLNPKGLPAYIEKMPKVLDKENMMLISYHLSRFIRTA